LVNVPPDRTLLQVLREDLADTSAKEGCGEGDCGACTVVLGEAVDGRIVYRAVNACIRLAHSVDGLALWTAADLASDPMLVPAPAAPPSAAGARTCSLHPVQEALVQCHGSQCGFCTPGFAMSLFGLYQNRIAPTLPAGRGSLPPEGALAPWGGPAALAAGVIPITRDDAAAALSGNLCRCTGYRPILDAAQTMGNLPPVTVNEAELLLKLEQLNTIPRWETGQKTENSALAAAYHAPQRLDEALALRAEQPQAQIVAGTTDVGLWITRQHRRFDTVLDLSRVAELRTVARDTTHLQIGAAVTLTDAFDALLADRPQLTHFARRFAGLPVRNSGTLGGNVANGSPIGDSMPLLIALGARVVLRRAGGSRELPLEDFYTGYRRTVLAADEILGFIRVPLPAPGEVLRAWKVSKRWDDDISAVCLAVCLQIEDGRIRHAGLGAGGVAATPVRARATEAALTGHALETATFDAAAAVLREEFQPLDDLRASAAYRRAVLSNLLRRFGLEALGASGIELTDPLTVEALA
jgi:xanthine dehydrogenase small subunit